MNETGAKLNPSAILESRWTETPLVVTIARLLMGKVQSASKHPLYPVRLRSVDSPTKALYVFSLLPIWGIDRHWLKVVTMPQNLPQRRSIMNNSHKFSRILVTALLIPVFLASTVGNVAWGGAVQNAQDALATYAKLLPPGSRGIGQFSEAINCLALALEQTRIDLGDPSGDLETFKDKCRFDINGVNSDDPNGALLQGLINLTGGIIWALTENLKKHKK
jgi:hypothetical protein